MAEMQGGDYMIHVFIIKGKNFIDASQKENIDAMFHVKTCGKQEYSKHKANTATKNENGTYWGEHLFFEPKHMSKDDMQAATVDIRLVDKGLFRDRLVGDFEIDVAQIYSMDKHALQNQWIAMNNPESADQKEITAYAKVSIAI
jgi:hypothetical protein